MLKAYKQETYFEINFFKYVKDYYVYRLKKYLLTLRFKCKEKNKEYELLDNVFFYYYQKESTKNLNFYFLKIDTEEQRQLIRLII